MTFSNDRSLSNSAFAGVTLGLCIVAILARMATHTKVSVRTVLAVVSSYVMLGLFFAYLDSGIGHIWARSSRSPARTRSRTTRTSATSRSRPSASGTSRPAPPSRGPSSSSRRSSGRSSSSRSSRGWCRSSAPSARRSTCGRQEEPRGRRVTSPHGSALPLGDEAESLLTHTCTAFPKRLLTLPGPGYLDEVVAGVGPLARGAPEPRHVYSHGRLGGTGYLSILPVDQGSSTPAAAVRGEPDLLRPRQLCDLALGRGLQRDRHDARGLGAVSRRYVAPDPVHRQAEPQRLPALPEHLRPGHVRARCGVPSTSGRSGVGATIYFGSPESDRQLHEVARRSRRHTATACSRCCGPTCATPGSRRTASTTPSPRTSRARRTTSA